MVLGIFDNNFLGCLHGKPQDAVSRWYAKNYFKSNSLKVSKSSIYK